MAIGQRLGIGNVESGANAARLQRGNQSVRLYDGPARGIHQQRALGQQCKLARADEAM
jgi:hypothetical protein